MAILWGLGLALGYFIPIILWGISYQDLFAIAQNQNGLELILQRFGLLSTTSSDWATSKLLICGAIILGIILILSSITVSVNSSKKIETKETKHNPFQLNEKENEKIYKNQVELEFNHARNAVKELREQIKTLREEKESQEETDKQKIIRLEKQLEIIKNGNKRGNNTNGNY